jgi:hypothetical protein
VPAPPRAPDGVRSAIRGDPFRINIGIRSCSGCWCWCCCFAAALFDLVAPARCSAAQRSAVAVQSCRLQATQQVPPVVGIKQSLPVTGTIDTGLHNQVCASAAPERRQTPPPPPQPTTTASSSSPDLRPTAYWESKKRQKPSSRALSPPDSASPTISLSLGVYHPPPKVTNLVSSRVSLTAKGPSRGPFVLGRYIWSFSLSIFFELSSHASHARGLAALASIASIESSRRLLLFPAPPPHHLGLFLFSKRRPPAGRSAD